MTIGKPKPELSGTDSCLPAPGRIPSRELPGQRAAPTILVLDDDGRIETDYQFIEAR